jgi:hypothetical protein
MTDNEVARIIHLEASLNTVDVRAMPEALLAILDEKFVEIDSTGRIWDAKGVTEALFRNPEPHDGEMRDVFMLQISDDVQILSYSSANGKAINRHTSVWLHKADEWRVIFHQQTQVI